MISKIRCWFSPPDLSDDDFANRKLALVNAILHVVLLFASLGLIGSILGETVPFSAMIVIAMTVVVIVVLRRLLNRRRADLVGVALIAVGFLGVSGVLISVGTVRAPVVAGFLMFVIAAGVLFGSRGILVTTAVSSAIFLGLVGAQNAGWLPVPNYAVDITQWVTFTVLCGLTGGLTYYVQNMSDQALRRSLRENQERQQAEAALQAANTELLEVHEELRAALDDLQTAHGELQTAHDELQAANDQLEQRVQERTIELAAVNQALERAVCARDDFLAAMSHELRTPLTGILGLSEALQYPHYGSLTEKQRSAVTNIQSSGQRLLDLITAVLDYTSLQSGKNRLQLANCSLMNVCQASLRAVGSKADAKQQLLDLIITPPDMVLRADERRLQQMLVALLDNAIKFTPTGGHIELAAAGFPDEQVIQLRVSDTGIGIAEDDFPALFLPFVQLDARLSRNYEGIGLGLALVRLLAELHGGRVEVESTPGQGSTFTLTLPWISAL